MMGRRVVDLPGIEPTRADQLERFTAWAHLAAPKISEAIENVQTLAAIADDLGLDDLARESRVIARRITAGERALWKLVESAEFHQTLGDDREAFIAAVADNI